MHYYMKIHIKTYIYMQINCKLKIIHKESFIKIQATGFLVKYVC